MTSYQSEIIQEEATLKERSKQALINGFVNLNILPERYRRKKFRPTIVIAYFVLFLLTAALFPLKARYLEADQTYQVVFSSLSTAQAQLEAYTPLIAEVESLENAINSARTRAEQIQRIYSVIHVQHIVWNAILHDIYNAAPAGLIITGLQQSETEVRLYGTANNPKLPLDLAANLMGSGLFSEVTIESIALHPETEDALQPSSAAESESPESDQEYLFELRVSLPESAALP